MPVSFKGAHFPQEIILMSVRWYVAYPWSYRHVEELMEERGVPVDHATIQRGVVKYSAQLALTQAEDQNITAIVNFKLAEAGLRKAMGLGGENAAVSQILRQGS